MSVSCECSNCGQFNAGFRNRCRGCDALMRPPAEPKSEANMQVCPHCQVVTDANWAHCTHCEIMIEVPPISRQSQERAAGAVAALAEGYGGTLGADRTAERLKIIAGAGDLDSVRQAAEYGILDLTETTNRQKREIDTLRREHKDITSRLRMQLDSAATDAAEHRRQLAETHAVRIKAAAAQFRAITGDFPGLTGPLVDLFKEVK